MFGTKLFSLIFIEKPKKKKKSKAIEETPKVTEEEEEVTEGKCKFLC